MSNNRSFNQDMPSNVRAEQHVLGSIFLDTSTLAKVMDILKPIDFYDRRNRMIYKAIIDIDTKQGNIEVGLVYNYFHARGEINAIGGPLYLSGLAKSSPTSTNVTQYAKIVKNYAIKRQMVKFGRRVAQSGYKTLNINDSLDHATTRIMNISKSSGVSKFKSFRSLIESALDRSTKLSKQKGEVTGLPTGYHDIDKITTGLHNNEFIVIAARPGMGKTTFALNLARNIAQKQGKTVAIFSLEMDADSLVDRIICAEGRIDYQHYRTGNLTPQEANSLYIAAEHLYNDKIYIDDTPGANIASIVARSRRLVKEHSDLGLVIVDYLQLVNGGRQENRQQEVSEVSRRLKNLAKQIHRPVLALCQLSRSVEQRDDKRPILSDIRESGSIEQDADIVAFLYRKDYYEDNDVTQDKNPAQGQQSNTASNQNDNENRSLTEFIIGKNRSGRRGTVKLQFLKNMSLFKSL